MPLALDYYSADARRSRLRRVAIATVGTSAIGGLVAAVLLVVLHPHPMEALPAGPVFLICTLRGGGDWEAILFIWIGGFILYGLYGFVTMLPSRTRHRVVVGAVCAIIHVCAAALC